MDAGPAVGGLDAEAGAIGLAGGGGIGLGHKAGDQPFGGVDQQAGGFAVRPLQDLSAGRRGGRGVDPGGGEGGGGDDHRVAVGAAEQDDAPRGGGVQVGGGQEAALRPPGLDPAAPDDGAVRMRLGPGRQSGHRIRDRGRAFEVQGQFAPAHAVQVGVAVGEAGEQGRALQVHHLQICGVRRVRERADIGDAAVADLDHLGGRRAVHAGVDRTAPDDQVLRLGRSGGSGQQQGEKERPSHLIVPYGKGLRTRLIASAPSSSTLRSFEGPTP